MIPFVTGKLHLDGMETEPDLGCFSMRATVIGSAAGGGFPQWNCGCPNCVGVRAGRDGLLGRTQDSLAVTSNGERFALVNASPDILEQIKSTPALWPRAPRHTPIGAIILTNGDMDHVLGLFSLRESQPLAIYATPPVWSGLEASVLVRTLKRFEGQVVFRPLAIGREVELADAAGEPLGLRVRPFAAPGKLPVHLMGHAAESAEDNVGLSLRRSEAVRSQLISLGVDPGKIIIAAFGEDSLRRNSFADDRRVTIWTTRESVASVIALTFAGHGTAVRWDKPLSVAQIAASSTPIAAR